MRERKYRGGSTPEGTVFLAIALLLLFGFQCQETTSRPVEVERGGQTAIADGLAPDFRIVAGSGGGFTGHWEGYLIEADGTVWSWSGIGVPSDTTRIGVLPADSLRALSNALDEAGFFADDSQVTGNVTAILEVTRDGRIHRTTWIPSVESVEPPKTPTEAVYRRIRAMAAAVSD